MSDLDPSQRQSSDGPKGPVRPFIRGTHRASLERHDNHDFGESDWVRPEEYELEYEQHEPDDGADNLSEVSHAQVCARDKKSLRITELEAERDGAIRHLDEHRCDEQAERAYKRVANAEAKLQAVRGWISNELKHGKSVLREGDRRIRDLRAILDAEQNGNET